ncbi:MULTISPECIES: DUF397 domain-containing protein [unclassified Streptomyces]|jgi:hypothetical protein|uniref:DUF397 domain-containing protein n=1 Tax=unclassified Streptomyces TaxID=2593676 RepID=UPI00235B3206|nr:DUF397 domain-containing protein [Streptomyces sp. TUS-ST3]GLP69789.1 hypothetical protein TUSST3_64100 [Streptomyces sp. TUS-ST3]
MNTQGRRRPPQSGFEDATWLRSSHSNNNGACVEIAVVEGVVAVRDSKAPRRPPLVFSPREWRTFLAGAADSLPHHH